MSACPLCEDGWLIDEVTRTASPCGCRPQRTAAVRPAAERALKRRRELCRRAGLASGRVRRRHALRRRGLSPAPGQAPLELDYQMRAPSRAEFEARYLELWPEPESPVGAANWARGRESVWQHLQACWRLAAACGQHTRTTKPQRARAMAARGRERCTRTIRRLNLRLEAMGYCATSHWHAPPGRRDCLILEWRMHRAISRSPMDVTPPSGTGNPGLRPGGSPRSHQPCEPEPGPPAPPAPSEPPDLPLGGESSEQERAAVAAAFAAFRRSISPYRSDGQDLWRSASTTSTGFKCSR